MKTLEFPHTAIAPEEDSTERALLEVLRVAETYETAIRETASVNRCHQLRERLAAGIQALTAAENLTLLRMDALMKEWD